MITITEAVEVLRFLSNEFDSHGFIEKYLTIFERQYVTMLMANIDNANIFRTVNASIGRFWLIIKSHYTSQWMLE